MTKYSHKYNVILDNMDLNEYRLRPIAAIMYVQDAFARFCATKRIAAYDLFPQNLYWIVSEFNIDFVGQMPFWSEEIEVEIWISELTKLKIYTDFNIMYKNKTFAKGNGCWFLIDTETKRPVKTDNFAEQLMPNGEYTLGEHKKFVLPECGEKIREIIHTTNLSDLDFNNHVNNKSYINLAEMTATDEFRKTHLIKQLNIKFLHETFLGDTLTCATYKTENSDTYIHKVEKEGVSVCEILTNWNNSKSKESILESNIDIKNYSKETVCL